MAAELWLNFCFLPRRNCLRKKLVFTCLLATCKYSECSAVPTWDIKVVSSIVLIWPCCVVVESECSLDMSLHHASMMKIGREPSPFWLSEGQVARTATTQDGVKEAEMESDGAKVTDLKVFLAAAFCLSSSDPPSSIPSFSLSHDVTGYQGINSPLCGNVCLFCDTLVSKVAMQSDVFLLLPWLYFMPSCLFSLFFLLHLTLIPMFSVFSPFTPLRFWQKANT